MAYKEYPFIQGRPYIPILIGNPANGIEVPAMGLIDSGADHCLFPAFIAKLLGHDLKAGLKDSGLAANNQAFITWKHPVVIHLLHPVKKTIKVMSMPECFANFSEEDGTPLLGVVNFLANFNITLLYRMQIVWLADAKQ